MGAPKIPLRRHFFSGGRVPATAAEKNKSPARIRRRRARLVRNPVGSPRSGAVFSPKDPFPQQRRTKSFLRRHSAPEDPFRYSRRIRNPCCSNLSANLSCDADIAHPFHNPRAVLHSQATRKTERLTIDIHGHILTKGYLDLLEAHGATREDGFPLPVWNEESALSFLDETGIRYQVLSLSSPHPYFGDAAESADFCRAFNDETARVVARHPTRFGFCAVVPLPNVAAAVGEATRTIGDLNALGVKLASNSRGLYLGDERLDPLFQRLESIAEGRDRDVVCLIHPSRPEPIAEGVFSAGPVPLYEFLTDSTRAVLNMIAHDVPRRFPRVQVVVPHCGSFLPNVARRIEGAQPILEKVHMMGHVDVPANLARLWFDTAGDSVPDLLPLLLTITGPDHVLFGSDYPFTPRSQTLTNIRRLQEFLASDRRLAKHADDILDNNARKLLTAAGALR